MDVETLFEMASAAARNAERNCTPTGGDMFIEGYGGYPAYIQEYNRLVPMVWEMFGEEAHRLFHQIDLGKQMNPADTIGAMWKTHAEFAAARLSALAAYLKTKQGTRKQEGDDIATLLEENVRPAMFTDPDNEKAVQDVIENDLQGAVTRLPSRAAVCPVLHQAVHPGLHVRQPWPGRRGEICNRAGREKELIDEINADILGYQGTYESMLFVIYDLGFIRDVALFKSDIELQPGVRVLTVKK